MADDTLPKGILIKYSLQEQFKGQTATHPLCLATQQQNPISRSYRNDYIVVIPGVSERFLSELLRRDSMRCSRNNIIESEFIGRGKGMCKRAVPDETRDREREGERSKRYTDDDRGDKEEERQEETRYGWWQRANDRLQVHRTRAVCFIHACTPSREEREEREEERGRESNS